MTIIENVTSITNKKLFARSKKLLFKPNREWKKIKNEPFNTNDILTKFNLPLIGICTIATFLGYLINNHGINLQNTLKYSVISFSTLFFGIYLTIILSEYILSILRIKESKQIISKTVLYASLPIYILFTITELIPEFFFVKIAYLYTLYTLWTGHKILNSLKEEQIPIAYIVYSALLLLMPYFINKVLLFTLSFIS